MVFNSLQFLVFFMVVTILFYRIKNQRGRIWLLLLSSCYFYMTFVPIYILILGFTIIIDYIAGILIASSDTQRKRKAWLTLSIISNVGILGFYKYFNSYFYGFGVQWKFNTVFSYHKQNIWYTILTWALFNELVINCY